MICERFELRASSRRDEPLDLHAGLIAAFLDANFGFTDIEPDMLRYLGERARREHLINLVPVQASADAVNLPEPVDVALVVDTYHHIGNRTQYFAKLKSSLRPAGRLVI